MSLNISLIQFDSDETGTLFEEKYTTIETAYINHTLLDEIKEKYPFREQKVFEERESKEYSIFNYFNQNNINDILSYLESKFINLCDSCNFKEIYDQNIYLKKVEEFRTISNIIHVLKLKNEKYKESFSSFIKVG